MFSIDYHIAMMILNKQSKRDWELESAARQVRKAVEEKDLYAMNYAEVNLRDVLRRRY
jgi:hypothetical protein